MARHHRAVAAGRWIVTKSNRPYSARAGGTVAPVLPARQCSLRIRRAIEVDVARFSQFGRGHSEANVAQIVAVELFRPCRSERKCDGLQDKQAYGKKSRSPQSAHH